MTTNKIYGNGKNTLEGYRARFTPDRLAKLLAGAKAAREARPLEVRLWEKVDKNGTGGCWLWTGALDTWGYGCIWHEGRLIKVHRAVLWLAGAVDSPEGSPKGDSRGLVADHTCRVRHCVNLKHLRMVTPRVNGTENNASPMARNARKTHCIHGHPLSGENLARILIRNSKRKRTQMWIQSRMCLTCWPAYWNHPRRFWLPDDEYREDSQR